MPLSVSSQAQESLPWQGAQGRPLPTQQGLLLSLTPFPRQPWRSGGSGEEATSRNPSWVQGAVVWSWLTSASLFSTLPEKRQPGPTQLVESLSWHSAKTWGSTPPPQAALCLPACGVTHTWAPSCTLGTCVEANAGTNVSSLGNGCALGIAPCACVRVQQSYTRADACNMCASHPRMPVCTRSAPECKYTSDVRAHTDISFISMQLCAPREACFVGQKPPSQALFPRAGWTP